MKKQVRKVDFPNIDYKKWFSMYDWDNIGTSQGMITTLLNKNLIDSDVTPKNISEKISYYILRYKKFNDQNDLFMVFKLIQGWGGKSAGSHTLKIISEWELNSHYAIIYSNFVNLIINGSFAEGFESLFNNNKTLIKGFGYSFIPKHICFWSGDGDRSKGQPILDNVIAKILYFEPESKNVNFGQFLCDMNEFSKVQNMRVAEIEMALFTFASYFWETGKTGTSIFKANIKVDDMDVADKEALNKIINSMSL